MGILIKLLLGSIAVIITSYLLPGVTVANFGSALIVAAVLALLNATLKPLLIILTIPVTVVTLGLFLLVINGAIILLADALVPGFLVDGFFWALLFSLIMALLMYIFEGLVKN